MTSKRPVMSKKIRDIVVVIFLLLKTNMKTHHVYLIGMIFPHKGIISSENDDVRFVVSISKETRKKKIVIFVRYLENKKKI